MLNENVKYVRRNAEHLLDSLFELLHAAPSPPCRWEITRCVGRVGHVMEGDIKRYCWSLYFFNFLCRLCVYDNAIKNSNTNIAFFLENYHILSWFSSFFRFVDVTLDRLDTWRAAEMKVLVLRCILEMLKLDSDGSQLSQVIITPAVCKIWLLIMTLNI